MLFYYSIFLLSMIQLQGKKVKCRKLTILFAPNSYFIQVYRILEGIDMRLRRLEFVVIGITLAFACFMGGFFTGRSWSAVNVTAVATQADNIQSAGIVVAQSEPPSSGYVLQGDTQNPTASSMQVPESASQAESQGAAIGVPKESDGKININLASQSELMDLPGIGTVLASRIVDYRKQHGDFARIEDIRNVSGIGEKRFEAIENFITVG